MSHTSLNYIFVYILFSINTNTQCFIYEDALKEQEASVEIIEKGINEIKLQYKNYFDKIIKLEKKYQHIKDLHLAEINKHAVQSVINNTINLPMSYVYSSDCLKTNLGCIYCERLEALTTEHRIIPKNVDFDDTIFDSLYESLKMCCRLSSELDLLDLTYLKRLDHLAILRSNKLRFAEK